MQICFQTKPNSLKTFFSSDQFLFRAGESGGFPGHGKWPQQAQPEAEDHKCKSRFSNGRLQVLIKGVSVSVFLMRVEFLSKAYQDFSMAG